MTCLSSRLNAIEVMGFECEFSAFDCATKCRVGDPDCGITSHNMITPAVPPVTIQRPSWDLRRKYILIYFHKKKKAIIGQQGM